MKYHFIGICGSSMSGLAQVMQKLGHNVTGCDLLLEGGHNPKHITKDLDRVVFSEAVTPQSAAWEEIERAKKRNIPVISRSQLIGQLMQEKIGIAVAGSHGKTTTAAMIITILEEAGLSPTYFIGGEIKGRGNAALGKGQYLVAEACEWNKQFLNFRPKIIVITNIEEEHLDTYPGGMREIKKAFKKFVKLLPSNGLLVLNANDSLTPYLRKVVNCKVKTFSSGKIWPGLSLKVPGDFNLLNATAAARVCHELGVPHKTIKKALAHFSNVGRRFEIKGERAGVIVVDDYAHHPTEIKATLQAARQFFPQKRLICVFQPHQYLRTELLFDEFARAFENCDKLILSEIFCVPGRDPTRKKITTSDLAKAIEKFSQVEVVYLPDYNEIVKYLNKNVRQNDVILTIGATKIYQVGERFLCQN